MTANGSHHSFLSSAEIVSRDIFLPKKETAVLMDETFGKKSLVVDVRVNFYGCNTTQKKIAIFGSRSIQEQRGICLKPDGGPVSHPYPQLWPLCVSHLWGEYSVIYN